MSLTKVNRDYINKYAADIRSTMNEVLSYSPKPYEGLSSAEKYATRYNVIVLAEALSALAMSATKWGITLSLDATKARSISLAGIALPSA